MSFIPDTWSSSRGLRYLYIVELDKIDDLVLIQVPTETNDKRHRRQMRVPESGPVIVESRLSGSCRKLTRENEEELVRP